MIQSSQSDIIKDSTNYGDEESSEIFLERHEISKESLSLWFQSKVAVSSRIGLTRSTSIKSKMQALAPQKKLFCCNWGSTARCRLKQQRNVSSRMIEYDLVRSKLHILPINKTKSCSKINSTTRTFNNRKFFITGMRFKNEDKRNLENQIISQIREHP